MKKCKICIKNNIPKGVQGCYDRTCEIYQERDREFVKKYVENNSNKFEKWVPLVKEFLEDVRIPEQVRVEYHRKFILDISEKE